MVLHLLSRNRTPVETRQPSSSAGEGGVARGPGDGEERVCPCLYAKEKARQLLSSLYVRRRL